MSGHIFGDYAVDASLGLVQTENGANCRFRMSSDQVKSLTTSPNFYSRNLAFLSDDEVSRVQRRMASFGIDDSGLVGGAKALGRAVLPLCIKTPVSRGNLRDVPLLVLHKGSADHLATILKPERQGLAGFTVYTDATAAYSTLSENGLLSKDEANEILETARNGFTEEKKSFNKALDAYKSAAWKAEQKGTDFHASKEKKKLLEQVMQAYSRVELTRAALEEILVLRSQNSTDQNDLDFCDLSREELRRDEVLSILMSHVDSIDRTKHSYNTREAMQVTAQAWKSFKYALKELEKGALALLSESQKEEIRYQVTANLDYAFGHLNKGLEQSLKTTSNTEDRNFYKKYTDLKANVTSITDKNFYEQLVLLLVDQNLRTLPKKDLSPQQIEGLSESEKKAFDFVRRLTPAQRATVDIYFKCKNKELMWHAFKTALAGHTILRIASLFDPTKVSAPSRTVNQIAGDIASAAAGTWSSALTATREEFVPADLHPAYEAYRLSPLRENHLQYANYAAQNAHANIAGIFGDVRFYPISKALEEALETNDFAQVKNAYEQALAHLDAVPDHRTFLSKEYQTLVGFYKKYKNDRTYFGFDRGFVKNFEKASALMDVLNAGSIFVDLQALVDAGNHEELVRRLQSLETSLKDDVSSKELNPKTARVVEYFKNDVLSEFANIYAVHIDDRATITRSYTNPTRFVFNKGEFADVNGLLATPGLTLDNVNDQIHPALTTLDSLRRDYSRVYASVSKDERAEHNARFNSFNSAIDALGTRVQNATVAINFVEDEDLDARATITNGPAGKIWTFDQGEFGNITRYLDGLNPTALPTLAEFDNKVDADLEKLRQLRAGYFSVGFESGLPDHQTRATQFSDAVIALRTRVDLQRDQVVLAAAAAPVAAPVPVTLPAAVAAPRFGTATQRVAVFAAGTLALGATAYLAYQAATADEDDKAFLTT